ncbi:hypothetical protein KKE68_00750 [Patescibacteria group bacterium]|nr:hypothetical protein [Patescibacteria group bacterium]
MSKKDTIAFEDRIVGFPQLGNYGIAIAEIAKLFGKKVILPPPITKRTIELGTKHSPEGVCVPFKYNLGNYIELVEKGANCLIQAGAGCRYGYYGEVQKKILADLGYNVQFITLNRVFDILGVYKKIKSVNPRQNAWSFGKTMVLVISKLWVIDAIEDICRKNIGFEARIGHIEGLFKAFLAELTAASTLGAVRSVKRKYSRLISSVPITKPYSPLRVGVVGEVYILMEPFSNFYLEKTLGKMGVEIHRFVDVTSVIWDSLHWRSYIKRQVKKARPYLTYDLGAHGTSSVAISNHLMKQGFDGIIHIKPFGCLPEINAMPMLNRVSRDYHCPVVYFSFDSQTSENGVKTRLEAFYDMLVFKRKKKRKI